LIVVFASLAVQFRIYYGRWMYGADILQFSVACLVLKELDQQFVDGHKRASVRYQVYNILELPELYLLIR
jgi:uncharacterized membrane protein